MNTQGLLAGFRRGFSPFGGSLPCCGARTGARRWNMHAIQLGILRPKAGRQPQQANRRPRGQEPHPQPARSIPNVLAHVHQLTPGPEWRIHTVWTQMVPRKVHGLRALRRLHARSGNPGPDLEPAFPVAGARVPVILKAGSPPFPENVWASAATPWRNKDNMIDLTGKTAVIFGLANKRSIAWGVAQKLHQAGATLAICYQNERMKLEAEGLIAELPGASGFQCDVSNDDEIETLFAQLKDKYGKLDAVVHAVAFAPAADLRGDFLMTSRDGFRTAMDVSVYSLIAVTRGAAPLMAEGGSVMTMSYYAAEKVVPNYNVMALAKSALESAVRYLAWNLGPRGIRVNAISAGPIKTLAARGVGDLTDMLREHAERAPLKRNVDQLEVGDSALFLASPLSTAITGEVLYVDCGYNIMGF